MDVSEISMTRKTKALLEVAFNKDVVSMDDAKLFYSDKKYLKSTFERLVLLGLVSPSGMGKFRLTQRGLNYVLKFGNVVDNTIASYIK